MFVGDAAGLTHPITGAGIAAAVQSGERAGLAAAEYIRGDGQALAVYDEDMREQYRPTLERACSGARSWRSVGVGPRPMTIITSTATDTNAIPVVFCRPNYHI